MKFDFSALTNMDANKVIDAFNSEPQEVVSDIAKEIKSTEQTPMIGISEAPDFDIDDEIETVPSNTANTLTAEDIKKQAEFLKQQKEKSESKEQNNNKQKAEDNTKKSKETKKTTTKKSETKKEKPIEFSRPRRVMAYGTEVYTETNAHVSLEDIRNILVTQYGFTEFKDIDRCQMVFDAKSGEVYPNITFKKKG